MLDIWATHITYRRLKGELRIIPHHHPVIVTSRFKYTCNRMDTRKHQLDLPWIWRFGLPHKLYSRNILFGGGVGSLSCIWYILGVSLSFLPAPRNHNREREGISWCGERKRFKSFREGPWPPMKKRTAGSFGKLHETKNSLGMKALERGFFRLKKTLLNWSWMILEFQ